MSDITKAVNMGIPPQERRQEFFQTDAGQGDIILVKDSLGKPASKIIITPTSANMSIRVNVYQFNAPTRQGNDLMWTDHLPNLALGHKFVDTSTAAIVVPVNTSLTLDGPIKDIQLVTVSGNYSIIAV